MGQCFGRPKPRHPYGANQNMSNLETLEPLQTNPSVRTTVQAGPMVVNPTPQQIPNQPIAVNPVSPAPVPTPDRRVLVRALYRYDGQNDDDVRFEKGDIMEVISNMGDAWWYARHLRTNQEGYIPSNYVLVDDGRPTSLEAWYEIGRREADRLLLLMGNPRGSYIIRPSSAQRNYALSIRNRDTKSDMWVVKHYKVKTLDNGGYFISSRMTFATIQELISHYQNHADGLCCRLTAPCPRNYRPPVQFRDIEVNRNSIRMVRKLGGGSFGEVWLARWNDAIEVAVKTLKPGSMDPDRFIEEAKLMHRLHHPRIVQLLGVCTRETPTYIITELMTNGALLDYLRHDEGRSLKLNDLIDMMAQVTQGMAYLESMMFVHRDLRAANILVGENNWVKVADFGLARITQTEDDVYNADEGTRFPIKWTAPEAQVSRRFSIKSDVWSFGILMYEMVTYGRTPYPGMNNRVVLREVENGFRMPNPQTSGGHIVCPDELYNIMLECWDARAETRPTFQHLNDVFDNWSVSTESQYLEGQNA